MHVISCLTRLRTSVARAFRIEFLKAVYKATAKLCLVWGMTDCFFVVYSGWNQRLKLKFLKSSSYFHMWHPKAESAASINCGGLTVLLDKLNELTVQQDSSTLSHKSQLSELTRVIRLKDMKVLFKNHVYQVLLGIFCFVVTYHCRLAPWSYLITKDCWNVICKKRARSTSQAQIALLKTSMI